ncbi:hypothetical protein BLAT2472_10263 [Burkholderia latens]
MAREGVGLWARVVKRRIGLC